MALSWKNRISTLYNSLVKTTKRDFHGSTSSTSPPSSSLSPSPVVVFVDVENSCQTVYRNLVRDIIAKDVKDVSVHLYTGYIQHTIPQDILNCPIVTCHKNPGRIPQLADVMLTWDVAHHPVSPKQRNIVIAGCDKRYAALEYLCKQNGIDFHLLVNRPGGKRGKGKGNALTVDRFWLVYDLHKQLE